MTTFLCGAIEFVDSSPSEFCPHAPAGTFLTKRSPGWAHAFQSHAGDPEGECIRCGLRFPAFLRASPLRTYRDALTGLKRRETVWAYSFTGSGDHDTIRQRILGERVKEGR
jgi:hypothetical protein